jgi:L-lactate dehydrogenase
MERLGAKVTIVGVGAAGASIAFALATEGLATELALIDTDQLRAKGEAGDLDDAAAFIKPVRIYAADYPDATGSRVVVFSAGVPWAPGLDHLDIARRNIEILNQSFPRVVRYCPEAVFIIVTSPVDIITYAANRIADIGDEGIMGTGTVLDTSRFKRLLARHVKVDPRNVHAYVVGEHGQAEVPLWSRVSVAGFHIDEFCRQQGLPVPDRAKIRERIVNAAGDVAAGKGVTHFAASIAVARIVEAVLRDEHSVLTVSGMIEGVYGLEGPNCFSLPAVVDAGGRCRPLPLAMDDDEMTLLREAAGRLKRVHRELGLS